MEGGAPHLAHPTESLTGSKLGLTEDTKHRIILEADRKKEDATEGKINPRSSS